MSEHRNGVRRGLAAPGRYSTSLAQVTEKEATCVFRGKPWNAGVPTHVRLERLLLGPDGIEQVQGPLPVVAGDRPNGAGHAVGW